MSAELPELNPSQQAAIKAISAFITRETPIFLLRGSAGTGKTTLIAHLIKMLNQQCRMFQIIAPTGRAARILGAKTLASTSTIHGAIYSKPKVEIFEQAKSVNDPGMRWHFRLKQEDPSETVFIVDESSMVGDKESKGDLLQFGSGRLLADLIQYARLGRVGRSGERGAKIVFVGDPAQLPPVGETLSPALSSDYLKDTFDLDCEEFELTEVMRQQVGSAVLERATTLRDAISRKVYNKFQLAPAVDEIIESSIADGVSSVENALRTKSSSVFITYSNAQALQLNRAVRGRLWGDEEADLRQGDLLLINRNSFRYNLSNGDLVKVQEVIGEPERRSVRLRVKGEQVPVAVELGFRCVSVVYRAADGSCKVIECRLLENLLCSPERELKPLEQRALLVDFRQRFPDLRPKTDAFNIAIRDDPYFNALQVKYGYAMTCHKAQGGEWEMAVVEFGGGRSARNEEFFRWSYTAITRAKKKLITINAPNFNPISAMVWNTLSPAPLPDALTAAEMDPSGDYDWSRFGFTAERAPLFAYHLALRDAWMKQGITVEHLDHLHYAERYLLTNAGRCASVQYHYKGNLKVSTITAAPGSVSDPELLEEALDRMRKALTAAPATCIPPLDPFLAEFRDKLQGILEGTEIRLITAEPMQYRLRVEFEEAGHRAAIDFCYNGKQVWTSAKEVGGLGASQGALQDLRGNLYSF